MRFWFDTEFIEDGKTIDLISIGICAEDGREYYAEVDDCDLSKASPWVKENVLPHLTGTKITRAQLSQEIAVFVGWRPEFWAFYGAYDWVSLCQIYGTMMDLPKDWPMLCLDLEQSVLACGNPPLPTQTTTKHHALSDARWTKASWYWLQTKHASLDGIAI